MLYVMDMPSLLHFSRRQALPQGPVCPLGVVPKVAAAEARGEAKAKAVYYSEPWNIAGG